MTATTTKRGEEILVNIGGTGDQQSPAVTAINDRFVVVWRTSDQEQDGNFGAIKGRMFNVDGTPFGTEFLVNSYGAGEPELPAVTTLGSDTFIVTWHTSDNSQDGDGTAIKARIFNAQGNPIGNEFLVNTQTVGGQYEPAVADIGNGRLVISWYTTDAAQDGSYSAIKARVFELDGTPQGPEFLVNAQTFQVQSSPTIVATQNDRLFIAWQTADPSAGGSIKARAFDLDGKPLGNEFLVNDTSGIGGYGAQLSRTGEGNIVAVWFVANPNRGEIHARLFDPLGNPFGSEFLVSDDADKAGTYPSVIELGSGFAVTWETIDPQDLSGTAIKARIFDANGVAEGPGFLVNTPTTGSHTNPTIETLANGDFVVAWTTNSIAGGDGSGLAVKAQILDRNLPPIAQDFDLYTLAGQTLTFDNRFFPIDDPDPDYMEFPRLVALTNAEHGTVKLNSASTTFIPEAGFTGKAGFDFTIDDNHGATASAHASVYVFAASPVPEWRLFTKAGFAGAIGGNGTVNGTNGVEDITVIHRPGTIQFDASFNRGGDVIRFGSFEDEWFHQSSGSSDLFFKQATAVFVPKGTPGSTFVFSQYPFPDFAAASPAAAADAGLVVSTKTFGKLFLMAGGTVALGGDYKVNGTNAAEYVEILHGTIHLDASFNRGGDTVALAEQATEFNALRSGSNVVLTSTLSSVTIPVGSAGITLSFAGTERELHYDTALEAILLGTQTIGTSSTVLIA